MCGEREDHIFKSNEIICCSSKNCEGEMDRIAGPIGGSNILPLKLGEADRFIPFFLKSANKKITTQLEMLAVYKDLYSTSKKVKFKSEQEQVLNSHSLSEDDFEDDDDDDDDEDLPLSAKDDDNGERLIAVGFPKRVDATKPKARRGRPVRGAHV